MTSLPILQQEHKPITKGKPQMSEGQWSKLHKQGYRQVGNHSAVKICEWTRHMLRGKGGCYKYVFYGIRSHQCLQMTTSMFCASRCKFCWRGQKAPVSKEWYGPIDDPKHIINHAMDEHLKLLQGFKGKGYENTNKKNVEEMDNIRHVALSLTGEPITYPRINEILKAFHQRRISTFLVTNAQYPEQIEKIDKCTQLYLSIDAPNKELMKKIDRPLFDDFWERTLKSLDLLKSRDYRTCIRLSLIKGENMNVFSFISSIFKPAVDLIDELHTSDAEKLELQREIKKVENELLGKVIEYERLLLESKTNLISTEATGHRYEPGGGLFDHGALSDVLCHLAAQRGANNCLRL